MFQEGTDFLNEKMTMMVFLKRSGVKYKLYCQELYNNYNNNNNNFPMTIQEQHSRLDAWKPAYQAVGKKKGSSFVQGGNPKKKDKNKVVPGDQNYGGGGTRGGNNKYKGKKLCYKCDQSGCLFFECKHTTKENGQPVEIDECARRKFEETKKS